MSQTIVALATPYGRSGIAVIRLSGARSLEIVRKLIGDAEFNPRPRASVLKKIYDLETSDVMDEALITFFKSPHSFTGEDVIEISCHGSPILIRQTIDFCLKLDARSAEAGEFSLRALANGRMDLSQAEAVRDLIEARTIAAARQSVRQLRGELSNQLQSLKDDLLNLIVVLESSIEFVEDDLPDFQADGIKNKLKDIIETVGEMTATFRAGKLLRDGIKVVLAGRPNVGKSSLFNSLLGQEQAIVTEIAGTTRDSLREALNIRGIPVTLTDTAGLRETSDKVESIGVSRAKGVIADSDLVIILLDGSQALSEEDECILNDVSNLNYLIAINKIDLGSVEINLSQLPKTVRLVEISAKSRFGLDDLQEAIVEPFLFKEIDHSNFLISDARHFDLLSRAKVQLESSLALFERRISEEIVLIDLHNALRLIGQITGETTTEDVLTQIFSTFCIGK